MKDKLGLPSERDEGDDFKITLDEGIGIWVTIEDVVAGVMMTSP